MSLYRLVLDTNVLVSALINREGLEAAVLGLALNQSVQLCVSYAIVAEYTRVLYKPQLKLNLQLVASVLSFCQTSSLMVIPASSVLACSHEPDNRFLECAEAVEADFLVTRNKWHFPEPWKNTEVVNARELLDRLSLP